MRIVRTHACARAGLLGNPSDGYFGKTIALPVRNFRASVVLYEWLTGFRLFTGDSEVAS